MKVIPEKEEFLRMTIRNAIALNPLVSIRRMQEIVKHNIGRSISDKYTAKLMRKTRQGAIVQSDRKMMNERLAEVRERYRMLINSLTKIAFWNYDFVGEGIQCPKFNEQFSAMRLIGQLEIALFRAELDVGMFENKRAIIDKMLEQGVLPNELREQVVGVFRTWKLWPTNQQNAETEFLPVSGAKSDTERNSRESREGYPASSK